MTVAEMKSRMSAREYDEWRLYDLVEPIGDRRGDYHAALIATIIQNTFRDPKKGQARKVEDFLLFTDPEPVDLDPAEKLLRKFKAMPQFRSREDAPDGD